MVSIISKEQAADSDKLVVTVQGRKVTLRFADEPNMEVSALIKQALLSSYMSGSLLASVPNDD